MSRPIYSRDGRPRVKQNFTAIQVDDPYKTQDRMDSPQHSHTTRYVEGRRSMGGGNGFNDLISRQDQLLNHQMRVASRQDEIAQHLVNQNNALNDALLKQVLTNKDRMIERLALAQNSDWDESKELLSKHIRYMVAFIQRLNSDIAGLEAEIKGRDMAVIGTNAAVNKLEVHHVTMLQDVRSRIVRAEQAISKHTKDITSLFDEIRRVEGQIVGLRDKLAADIHRVEAEVISMTTELERQNGIQQAELSHFRSSMNQQMAMLEDRMKAMMANFQSSLDDNKANMDHHMDRMEAKFKAMIDKATEGWGDLMKQVDQRIDDHLRALLARLNKLENRMNQDRAQLQELKQSIETQVMAALQDSLNYYNAELNKAKNEFRKGFAELQDSIANLKMVVEGRRKILAHQVKKEIGAVRRYMMAGDVEQEPQVNTIVVRNNQKQDDGW